MSEQSQSTTSSSDETGQPAQRREIHSNKQLVPRASMERVVRETLAAGEDSRLSDRAMEAARQVSESFLVVDSDAASQPMTEEAPTHSGERSAKRCYFFHRDACRHGALCRFVHDEHLLTPQGQQEYRHDRKSRKKATYHAKRLMRAQEEGQSVFRPPPLFTAPPPLLLPSLPLCPYQAEAACEQPGCRLLHAAPHYFYRVVVK